MCENLLAEFFSSLFRDICMETYRLCPFSFAHWDIYMKTYSLCPFSFVSRDIYARKNAICPIAADIRDITEQKFSICPQTKKSPFFISRNTKSRQLSPTFVLQQTFVHYKTLQKGASCPTPFL